MMACEVCGTGDRRIVQHHWSYAKADENDTIPLCDRCHRKVHAGKIPEPRTGRIYEANVRVRPMTDADAPPIEISPGVWRTTSTYLAHHTSEILSWVEFGHRVYEIVRNGRVVAKMVPA